MIAKALTQMKHVVIVFLFSAIAFCLSHSAVAQQSWNMPLLSNWDDNTIPPAWTGPYSECWGYAANGREYAFLASTQGTYFFDITDPVNIELIDYKSTKDSVTLVVNKDYATYSHYLYAVSDQGDNSLQIFDLQYLPDSIITVYDNNTISKRCHTIFVENNRLYMCSNTRPDNSFGPMDVFSLSDPINPVLMGTLSNPGFFNVHEVFVKNDTAYCANGNNGLWIYDMKFPATPSLISVLDYYPESGYNHSAWLTNDSKTMAFTDENHGKGIKLFDMSDISDPQLKGIIRSNLLQVADPLTENGSVAHNPYIKGNVLLVSYYHDGIVAYDISYPAYPVRIAYYDTHPQNTNYYSYNGCWGLYPFLPSGNIIASDITNGLFILDGKNVLNYQPEIQLSSSLSLGLNPVKDNLEIFIVSELSNEAIIKLYDVTGKLVLNKNIGVEPGRSTVKIPLYDLGAGIYVANVQNGALSLTAKVMKLN